MLIPLGRVTVIPAFSIVPRLSMECHFGAVSAEGSTLAFITQGIVTVVASGRRQMAVQAGIMTGQVIQQPGPVAKLGLVRLIPAGLSAELSGCIELSSAPPTIPVTK